MIRRKCIKRILQLRRRRLLITRSVSPSLRGHWGPCGVQWDCPSVWSTYWWRHEANKRHITTHTPRQTDRQTDRDTDRQRDRKCTICYRRRCRRKINISFNSLQFQRRKWLIRRMPTNTGLGRCNRNFPSVQLYWSKICDTRIV